MKYSSTLLTTLFLTAATACSSGTDRGGPTPTPDGTSSLSGIWDVTADQDGNQSKARIELSEKKLLITDGSGGTFEFAIDSSGALAGSFVEEKNDDPETFVGDHEGNAFSFGAGLLPIGGSWTFTGDEKGHSDDACRFTLGNGSLTASCDDVHIGFHVRNKSVTGTRTKTAESIFGDLGGTWTVEDDKDGRSCTFTFEGKTFESRCAKGDFAGTTSLTFEETTLTGSSSSGSVEISGVKR